MSYLDKDATGNIDFVVLIANNPYYFFLIFIEKVGNIFYLVLL